MVAGSDKNHAVMGFVLMVHVLSLISVAHTQTYSNVDSLMTTLLTGYNKEIRPLNDQTQVLPVTMYLSPGAITRFTAADETISMTAVVILTWQDEKIQWTPSSYGGIQTVLLSKNDVWYPVLLLADPADDILTLGQSQTFQIAYTSTGYATMTAGMMIESMCEVDVTKWPFDTQECEIRFVTLNYDNNTMGLVAGGINFVYFTENGEFEITSTKSSSYILGQVPIASFTFTLKRRPTFLLVNIILPVIFLMILGVFVFFLPAESGERVGYSLTVLLSISVFFGVVNQFLPTTSKSMSNLTYYLMISFVLSTCICIGTLVSLRLHSKTSDDPIPNWLRFFCGRCRRGRKIAPDKTDVMAYSRQKPSEGEEEETKLSDTDAEMLWRDVAEGVDVVQFIFFSVSIIASIMWVFLYTAL